MRLRYPAANLMTFTTLEQQDFGKSPDVPSSTSDLLHTIVMSLTLDGLFVFSTIPDIQEHHSTISNRDQLVFLFSEMQLRANGL